MNNFIKEYSDISKSKKNCTKSTCDFFSNFEVSSEIHSTVTCNSKGIDIDDYVHKKNETHNGKKIVDSISVNDNNLFLLIEFKHIFLDMIDNKKLNKNRNNKKIYKEFDINQTRDDCVLSLLNQKFQDTMEYLKSKKINYEKIDMIFVYKLCDNNKKFYSYNHFNSLVSNLRKKIIINNLVNFKVIDYYKFEKNCSEYNINLNN